MQIVWAKDDPCAPEVQIKNASLKIDHLSRRVQSFANGKMRQFWKRSKDKVFEDIHQTIVNHPLHTSKIYRLKGDNFSIDMTIKSSDGKLIVKIDQIKLKGVSFGQRPNGLNMEFGHLMSVLMDSILEKVNLAESIESVEIVGKKVVNQGLVKIFNEFGFQSSQTNVARSNIRNALFSVATGPQSPLHWVLRPPQNPGVQLPTKNSLALQIQDMRPSYVIGLDWHLHLDVVRVNDIP